jgi:hypothetical protein
VIARFTNGQEAGKPTDYFGCQIFDSDGQGLNGTGKIRFIKEFGDRRTGNRLFLSAPSLKKCGKRGN